MRTWHEKHGSSGLAQLVVLATAIALLVVTLSPAFIFTAKRKAREARCIGNMKQIGIALEMWKNNSETDRYPLWNIPGMAGKNKLGSWPDMLTMSDPYSPDNIEKHRENLEKMGMSPDNFMKTVDNPGVFHCPSDDPHPHRINMERAKAKGFWREDDGDGYEYSYGISVAAANKHSLDDDGTLVEKYNKDASIQVIAADGVWDHIYNFSAAYVDDPKSKYDDGGWWCNRMGYFHGNKDRAIVVCRDNSAHQANYGEKGKGIDPNKLFFYGPKEGLKFLPDLKDIK